MMILIFPTGKKKTDIFDKKNPYAPLKLEKIKAEFRTDPDQTKLNYPDLFYYYDGMVGTRISQSVHPAGMVISPRVMMVTRLIRSFILSAVPVCMMVIIHLPLRFPHKNRVILASTLERPLLLPQTMTFLAVLPSGRLPSKTRSMVTTI